MTHRASCPVLLAYRASCPVLLACFALLAACGGSPPVAPHADAGSSPDDAAVPRDDASSPDAAVVEPQDAATTPDAWAPPGALGELCDSSRPCAPELVCDGSFGRAAICAQPARSVPGVVAYFAHPWLAVAIGAPLASSDIVSVELDPLDAFDAPVGEPYVSAYVAGGESGSDGSATFYVRCLAGSVVTASITLVDAAGGRSEPMLVTPIAGERVGSGELCDGVSRFCGLDACALAADGEMRCP